MQPSAKQWNKQAVLFNLSAPFILKKSLTNLQNYLQINSTIHVSYCRFAIYKNQKFKTVKKHILQKRHLLQILYKSRENAIQSCLNFLAKRTSEKFSVAIF